MRQIAGGTVGPAPGRVVGVGRRKVARKKQAIAIGLSEARKKGAKVARRESQPQIRPARASSIIRVPLALSLTFVHRAG